MKTRLFLGLGLVSLVACSPSSSIVPKSSGSIGISPDDSIIYVADADNARLTAIDTKTRDVLAHVDVGEAPERVLVADDGAVFVTNRGSRSVTRVAPGATMVEATAEVGAEPVGMALSPDGQRLYVANSMSGTLTVLEAKSLTPVDELQVGGQPWAVSLLADGRTAYVTDFLAGDVKVVDLGARSVTSTVQLAQRAGVECQLGIAPQRTPAQAADVVISPDGTRAYIGHVQSRTGTDGMQLSMALAVAPALSTIELDRHQLMEEPASGEGADFPSPILATSIDEGCRPMRGGPGMDAPSSLVVDGSGAWIFVADHNSNAVAIVSAFRVADDRARVPERGIYEVVRVGARPTGIAVSGDLLTAYVHNALDHSVSVLKNEGGRLIEQAVIPFASSPLPPEVDRGRRLFYSAVDDRLTTPELGGVSCSSCHPDGRTDGLNWVFPGADRWTSPTLGRNTQPLWGVLSTAPYHWDGMLDDLPAFSSLMVSRMGGQGLDERELEDLAAYLAVIPAPDNPNLTRRPAEELELVELGEQVFSERCSACHSGPALTDGKTHLPYSSTSGVKELDTPSLRGAFATPPYLHDGSARTLRDVVLGARFTIREHDQRGLDASQAAALELYLKTL